MFHQDILTSVECTDSMANPVADRKMNYRDKIANEGGSLVVDYTYEHHMFSLEMIPDYLHGKSSAGIPVDHECSFSAICPVSL